MTGLLTVSLELYDGVEPAFAQAFHCLAFGPKIPAGQLVYLLMVTMGLEFLVAPGLYLGARLGQHLSLIRQPT